MREKLREMDLRITELCDYLHFSRPTMYRFIENYEAKKYRGIDRGVLTLFRYIDNTPEIGKKNVISFIINNITIETDSDEESKFIALAKRYETGKNATQSKTELIQKLMSSSELDNMVEYIAECERILSKENLEEEYYERIGKYVLFRYDIEKGTKLTKKQMETVMTIMRERI